MRAKKSHYSGIEILAFLLLFYSCLLFAGMWGEGHIYAWRMVGVDALSSMFFDLHPLLNGFSCMERGIDIMRTNPCDPMGRTMNYPPVWLGLNYLGANAAWVIPLGSVMVAGFVASVFWLFRNITPARAFFAALCICSPSVMMGVERGNVDLLIFPLLMFGATHIQDTSRRAGLIAMACLMMAIILKLYPLFAVAALLLLPSSIARQRLFVVLAFGLLYLVLEWNALALIQQNTPIGTELSYGIMTPWLVLTKPPYMEMREYSNIMFWGVRATVVVIALIVFALVRRHKPPELKGTPELALFLGGAGIFFGTYILTNNWDYRLVFLLLCLPWLMADKGAYALVLAVLWLSAFSAQLFYLDELLAFILWVSLGVMLLQLAAQDFLPFLKPRR